MSRPLIALVILQYGKAELTLECLNSISPQLTSDDRVILIENGNRPGFQALHAGLGEPALERVEGQAEFYRVGDALTLIYHRVNAGYGAGNNLGAAYAFDELQAEYVWVLNNDTRLNPDALAALRAYLQAHPQAHLLGQTVLEYGSDRVQALAGARYHPLLAVGRRPWAGLRTGEAWPSEAQVVKTLDYLTGASFVVSRELYSRVGLFDPRFFLYFEEIDLARRAQAAGYRLHWARQVKVEHREGASISPQEKSELSEYHATLSSLLFTAKHFPLLLPFTLVTRLAFKLPRYAASRRWPLIRAHLAGIRAYRQRRHNGRGST